MRILLIHRYAPYDPSRFDWTRLVALLSATHEVLSTWWVVEDKKRLESELAAGVLTTEEFRSFAPDLVLLDGSPDPRSPGPGEFARKVPWPLEEEFRGSGGVTFFLRAVPDINIWEMNRGYAEYGFPLAKSRMGGAVYVACPPNNSTIKIKDWQCPADLLASRDTVTLGEVIIERPWVLDDRVLIGTRPPGRPLFWSGCDVKDPVWRHEGQLENEVRKPYVIAAWKGGLAPVFLVTGDMFSDWMIDKGQNGKVLHFLVGGAQVLSMKRKLVLGRPSHEHEKNCSVALSQHAWDVFICHASEDKDNVARPLAGALIDHGLHVWLDEIELKIGDNLLRRIDNGLAQSRYGVVILSPHFFAKQWPRRELDGLTTRELADGSLIVLPIWHNVSHDQVSAFSLTLANRFAGQTDDGILQLANQIFRRIAASRDGNG